MGILSSLRTRLFGHKPERLYFVTRSDLSPGRQAAQLIHAMDEWAARFGPQQGTVIVYEVANEQALLEVRESLGPQTVVFREPDLGHSMTALATAHGPLKLPLLKGRKRGRYSRAA